MKLPRRRRQIPLSLPPPSLLHFNATLLHQIQINIVAKKRIFLLVLMFSSFLFLCRDQSVTGQVRLARPLVLPVRRCLLLLFLLLRVPGSNQVRGRVPGEAHQAHRQSSGASQGTSKGKRIIDIVRIVMALSTRNFYLEKYEFHETQFQAPSNLIYNRGSAW